MVKQNETAKNDLPAYEGIYKANLFLWGTPRPTASKDTISNGHFAGPNQDTCSGGVCDRVFLYLKGTTIPEIFSSVLLHSRKIKVISSLFENVRTTRVAVSFMNLFY